MSHSAVRTLIRDSVLSVQENVNFIYARASDFNSIKDKSLPFVQLDPLNQTAAFTNNQVYSRTFRVAMVFYKLDALQGAEEETAAVLDEMDLLCDRCLTKLNLGASGDDPTVELTSQTATIANIRKTPVIKVTADMLTGWMLEFDMTVPDTFDYCKVYG